ncbi:MAG: DNA polymerase IV [Bowdeniella nasicola]|nr:DNA polymerase IV [Bowdeniella nasicola]
MSRGPRPKRVHDWGNDDTGAHVLHVDMDCFYASVELLYRPELRGQPVIVGGSGDRGVVTSATYEARAFGVHAAMPIGQARRLCPHAVVLPNRRGAYSQVSRTVMSVLERVTPVLERVSIDEAFLDISGAVRRMGPPTQIARWIREHVAAEAGVPASVGIAGLTHVAKLASTFAKPDGMLLIPLARTHEFLHSLPVGALPGVGARSEQVCERHGLRTVADLLTVSPTRLGVWLGRAQAAQLRRLAAGEEVRGIHPHTREKSIGTEETFATNRHDVHEVGDVIVAQAHSSARRLRIAGLMAGTVSIKVRYGDFHTLTRSRSLTRPTDVGAEVARVALDLFSTLEIPAAGIRLVGTRLEGLTPRDRGVQLAFDDDGRQLAAERAADAVVRKFGSGTIGPARTLGRTGERG